MTNLSNTIILLNAPKGSGKDTIANRLSELTGVDVRQFKEHLYQCTATLFNVPVEHLKQLATDRTTKEVPNELFKVHSEQYNNLCKAMNRANGATNDGWKGPIYLSPRQALIYTSECVIKPNMGEEYFGKIAADSIIIGNGAVFSDSGFIEELNPIINKYGCLNVFVVQFNREGCSFEGDSRNYLDVPTGIPTAFFNNDKTIDEICSKILDWIKRERDLQQITFGEIYG